MANQADMQSLHRLAENMQKALILSGYAKPDAQSLFEEKLRRLVLRMQLSQADAETCTAMFRQILWKIGQGPRETR
jgi:tRNA C32,U32 (ribose-2'-O)-methylase TrmJ